MMDAADMITEPTAVANAAAAAADKSQEELSSMLRLLIANFCDQHFVKQIQRAKLQSSASTSDKSSTLSPAATNENDTTITTASTTNTSTNVPTNESKLDDPESDKAKQEEEEVASRVEASLSDAAATKKMPTSGDTPPPSSSASSSSDIAMHCEGDSSNGLEASSTTDGSPQKAEEAAKQTIQTNENHNHNANTSETNNGTFLLIFFIKQTSTQQFLISTVWKYFILSFFLLYLKIRIHFAATR